MLRTHHHFCVNLIFSTILFALRMQEDVLGEHSGDGVLSVFSDLSKPHEAVVGPYKSIFPL